jgi:hypothetical protein
VAARVGREIERYVREREEEMRKQQGGMTRDIDMLDLELIYL